MTTFKFPTIKHLLCDCLDDGWGKIELESKLRRWLSCRMHYMHARTHICTSSRKSLKGGVQFSQKCLEFAISSSEVSSREGCCALLANSSVLQSCFFPPETKAAAERLCLKLDLKLLHGDCLCQSTLHIPIGIARYTHPNPKGN